MPTPTSTSPGPADRSRRGQTGVLVAALCVAYFAMAVTASRTKSASFDEPAHLLAGYAAWQEGDFRLVPDNGIFPQRWVSLPYLLTKPALPPRDEAWRSGDAWRLGFRFFSESGNQAGWLLLQGRCMAALLGALTAGMVFFAARRLHGPGGGVLALTLAVFCPAMLAHGAVATSDMAFAGVLLAATLAVWELLHAVTPWRLCASLAAVALLFLTKLSAPLFVPLTALIVGVRLASTREFRWELGWRFTVQARKRIAALIGGLALIHLVFVWGAVWAAYDFRHAAAPPEAGAAGFAVHVPETIHPGMPARMIARLKSARLLPEAYVQGYEQMWFLSRHRLAFFNGKHAYTGWRSFFPYAFLVKTPLAFFPLFAFALWRLGRAACSTGRPVGGMLYPLAPLLAILLAFGAAAISARLNIGHRHLLPLYPPLYILAGAAWPALARSRWPRLAVAALTLGFVAESWAIRPHYLAYFNSLDGGPDEAWRHLVDSSLDWGMDLPALSTWLKQEQAAHGTESLYLAYFGTASPVQYGIHAQRLPGYFDWRPPQVFSLEPGLYAVSATLLQVYPPYFGPWNRTYEDRYQRAVDTMVRFDAASVAEQAQLRAKFGEAYWSDLFQQFDYLRFGRLSVWLRRHPPVAKVAHTIFVWRLSADDLKAALLDPSAELADQPISPPP